MAPQVFYRVWMHLLVAITFLDLAGFTLSSSNVVILTGTRISTIGGLLVPSTSNLEVRQQLVCPFAGGIFCTGTDYCCPPGSFCQPLNPSQVLACCPSATAMSCNGNTACCDKVTEQCCTGGCCLVDNLPPPPPLPTTNTLLPPTPTQPSTSFPKGTIGLDYQDMLRLRPSESASLDRVGAVHSLFKAMCLGMQKAGTLSSQTVTFTYAPSQQTSNRLAVCGSVPCGSGQTCDEFPFSSTTSGGSKNTVGTCIDIIAASIQAAFLGSFFVNSDVSANDNYEFRLANVDCSAFLSSGPSTGGSQAPSGLTASMQPIQLLEFSPFSDFDIHNHSVYYLGNLTAGQYTVNVQVTEGIVDALHILDYQGSTYATSADDLLLGIIDPPFSLSFTIPQNTIGMTLVVDTVIDYKISASMIVGPGGGSSPSSGPTKFGPSTTVSSVSGGETGSFPPGIQHSSSVSHNGGGLLFLCVSFSVAFAVAFLGI